MKSNLENGRSLDFSNTEIAFATKSDKELKKAIALFSIMGKPWVVRLSSSLGLWAINNKIPLAKTIIRHSIFKQFCGGTSVRNCKPVIDLLASSRVYTVLDYGGEAKTTEEEFDDSRDELLRAIGFAAEHKEVRVVSMKITALVKTSALEKHQAGEKLSAEEKLSFERLKNRLSAIGNAAENSSVALFVDAEESWFQDVIDALVDELMQKHNHTRAIIYNTYQLYRHDRLAFLKASHVKARKGKYILGAKLVRGAYMEKERARAKAMGYLSPIQENKLSTDKDYNKALQYCIDNHEGISFFNASHNEESNQLLARQIIDRGITRDHPHFNFCQLYGMSDQITFNLADAGYTAMKYLPYGQIREVIPYLIRRSQENSSVSGDMGREYKMLVSEKKRRAKFVGL